MTIRNTTEDMRDPANRLGFLLDGMATGSPSAFIERQEADGQRQLVNSTQLPTEIHGDRGEFEALGFTFGEPDRSDPTFAPATLPAGWKREASDHAMWSYIIDDLGYRRVAIFYKAAFYDRSAFMRLESVYSYVITQLWGKKPIVTGGSWATVDAVREALAEIKADRVAKVAEFQNRTDSYWAGRVQELQAEIAEVESRLAGLGVS